MKTIVAETSLETNILLLSQILLKFSSTSLPIEYQLVVLAHTDLRKYEVKMGISSNICKYMQIEKKTRADRSPWGFLPYLCLGTSFGYELLVTSCRGHEMLVYRLFTLNTNLK